MEALRHQTVTQQDLVDLGRQYNDQPLLLRRTHLFFGMETRADFYDDLAEERRRAVRLPDALFNIWEIETRGGTARLTSSLGVLIPVILYRMHDLGQDFDLALEHAIPPLETLVLSTAPKSGLNPELLTRLAAVIRKLATWSRSLLKAAAPVVVILTMIIAVFYGTGAYYFPKLLQWLPRLSLRGEAAALYAISNFFLHWGWLVFMSLIAGTIVMFHQAPLATGPARKAIDGIWPATLYRKWAGIGFLVALATLIHAKRQDKDALVVLAEKSTPYVRERIDAILATDDKKLGYAMEASGYEWPDDMTIRKVKSAMRSDDPGTALANLADTMLDRMNKAMEATAALISWLGTIVVSLIIGWMVLAMNDISNQIQAEARQHTFLHH